MSSSDASCVVRLYNNVTEKLFTDYMGEFRQTNQNVLFSRRIDNLTAEYFGAEGILYGFVYDHIAEELRIIADRNNSVPSSSPVQVPKKTPVKLWQFEVDHSLIDCGMCYILQCSDYSFFIIDSPHTYSVRDDIRIYDFLKSQVPVGEKVVVSGWFFSHGHADHICKFVDVLKYNTEIIIEGVYFNFAPDDHPDSFGWDYADRRNVINFYEELKKHADIPVYRLHTGERFFVKNLQFDVLCTHEDVYPHSLENYNDSSTVLMMTVGDDKVCFPGDAGAEESAVLERRYPDFLLCNIMQVSHHGHFGCSKVFYELASAETVLFPVTKIKYDEEYPRLEANRVADELAKHNFIASDGTVEFTFPLSGSEIKIYPDETFENFDGIFNLWTYEYTTEYQEELYKQYLSHTGYITDY